MFRRASPDTSGHHLALSDLAEDYLKEEQKQRRREIENLIARIESDQRNGLIFTGAIWGWLATHTNELGNLTENPAKAIYFLPTFIMVFYCCRWYAIERTIDRIAEYTRKLEGLFMLPENYG